jgi:two-component sensor histidine kinase
LYPLLLEHRLPVAVRYLIAICIMLVCALLQIALQLQTGLPGYFLLMPGIFVCGLVLGRGSGILAAAIALVVGAYLSFAGEYGIDFLANNSLFAVTAAGTAAAGEFLRAEMKRVMHADKTKALLLQAMAHRTKNNLAILGAMIRMQSRNGGQAVADAMEATARRLQVMAEVYDHLSLRQDSRLVDMRYFLTSVVEKVFQTLLPSGPVAFQVHCDDVSLPNGEALTLGIVTNELVINALKYAFPDDRAGQINVRLSASAGIELSVCDNGVGLSADPVGLGSRIVSLLAQQLSFTLLYERLETGTCVRLRGPSR